MKLIILIPFIYQRAQHQSCLRRTAKTKKYKLGINWWKIKENSHNIIHKKRKNQEIPLC